MVNREALLKTFVEVELKTPEDFLKIKETLTRIGIESKRESNRLTQTCHILHKQGKYYIVHFKELFALDGRKTTLDEKDVQRRNLIARLLSEWNLCELVTPLPQQTMNFRSSNLTILLNEEKKNWTLVSKYNIGRKNKNLVYDVFEENK